MSRTLITSRDPKGLGAMQKFEAAYNKAGLDEDCAQRLNENRYFWRHIANSIREFSADHPTYELARSILGDDFITPEDIADARGLKYPDYVLSRLSHDLPSQETLEWCRDNNMMLIAGPPRAMTLADFMPANKGICRIAWAYAHPSDYYETIRIIPDQVKSVWFAHCKEPIIQSENNSWLAQARLIRSPLMIPNVAESAWALSNYIQVCQFPLLQTSELWTGTSFGRDAHLLIGRYDSRGLNMRIQDDARGGDGIATVRILSFPPKSDN